MGLDESGEENLFQKTQVLCTQYNEWFEKRSHPSAALTSRPLAVLPRVDRPVAVTSRAWSMTLRRSFMLCNNRKRRVTGGTRTQAPLLKMFRGYS